MTVAAPSSWAVVDLATETPQGAAERLNLHGATASAIVKDMDAGQKFHEVFVFDVKAAVDSPQGSIPILSAYCTNSFVTDAGAAGVPLLKKSDVLELGKAAPPATHITQKDLDVGGVPGEETSWQQARSVSADTIYGSQLAVLPRPGELCTVGVGGQFEGNVVSVAAATAQFL